MNTKVTRTLPLFRNLRKLPMSNGTNTGNNTQYDTTFDGNERRSNSDHAIRIALLEQSMESIKTQLKGINENMSKLVWLVFTALIIGILKLVIIGV